MPIHDSQLGVSNTLHKPDQSEEENVDNSINRVRFSYEKGHGIFLHEKQNAP